VDGVLKGHADSSLRCKTTAPGIPQVHQRRQRLVDADYVWSLTPIEALLLAGCAIRSETNRSRRKSQHERFDEQLRYDSGTTGANAFVHSFP
jgi:hypothetical protein